MPVTIIAPTVEILTPHDEVRDWPKRIERAGRECYASTDRATEDSAVPFVRRLMERGHDGPLEHVSLTVLGRWHEDGRRIVWAVDCGMGSGVVAAGDCGGAGVAGRGDAGGER